MYYTLVRVIHAMYKGDIITFYFDEQIVTNSRNFLSHDDSHIKQIIRHILISDL